VGSVNGDTSDGGLIGSGGATINDSYWDKNKSGLTTSAGGTGLSTENMTGFDAIQNMNFTFGDVWRFSSADEYPILARETEATGPRCSQIEIEYNGEGTSENPYEIGNSSRLANLYRLQCISENLDGVYELTSDINASETAEWYGGSGFNPIGGRLFRGNTPFSGSFDGNNNTIKGLTISRGEDFVGLFGVIENGYVSNVSLMSPDVSGEERVGALVGENRGGSVTNVNVISGSLDGQRVGGVAGMNRGTVSNTSVTGSINSNGDRVGGLAASNRGTVSWSYSTASVDGKDPNNAGGLVGHNFGLVEDSYATGSVSGGSYVGGLVGTMSSDAMVSGTYAAGNVTGNSNTGGLVGRSRGGSVMSSYWDNESTGQDTSEGGTKLTTSEMQGFDAAQSMTGLDFEGRWSAKNGSYPELRTASGTATPTASFAYSPEAPITSESIEFNASGSTDNGTIESYGWSFGDGESGTGEKVTHEYDEPRTYTVTLTVVNDEGATDTTTKDVEVTKPVEIESLSSVAPNGSLKINYAVREGTEHQVKVSPSGNATVNFTEYDGSAGTNLGSGYDNSSENSEGVAVLNASESNGSFSASADVANGTDGEILDVSVTTAKADGTELNTTSEEVSIDDGHPSGVSQDLFIAVANQTGDPDKLEREDVELMFDEYFDNKIINGERLSREKVIKLTDWFFR
jgi:PKD repeat protein